MGRSVLSRRTADWTVRADWPKRGVWQRRGASDKKGHGFKLHDRTFKKWEHPHHRTHGHLCIPGRSYCKLLLVLLVHKTTRNSAPTGLYSKVNASNCDVGSVNERIKGWGVNQIVNMCLFANLVKEENFPSDSDEHFRQNEDYLIIILSITFWMNITKTKTLCLPNVYFYFFSKRKS